jgi:hypothetical protein
LPVWPPIAVMQTAPPDAAMRGPRRIPSDMTGANSSVTAALKSRVPLSALR